QIGNSFASIGGLRLTGVNTYYDNTPWLGIKTGLNLEARPVDSHGLDGSGQSLLAVTIPSDPSEATDLSFITFNVASNTITRTEKVAINKENFPIDDEWILHTGVAIRGNQAFQTILPFDSEGWKTKKTDRV